MLHRVASRLQRTNFGFICNFTLAEEFEEDREKEGGEESLRFGGIFGNQSLDVIVGHINSALASQQCCIRILKTNVPPTASSFDFNSISVCNCVLVPIGSTEIGSLAGLAITQKRRLDRQPDGRTVGRTVELSVILSFV